MAVLTAIVFNTNGSTGDMPTGDMQRVDLSMEMPPGGIATGETAGIMTVADGIIAATGNSHSPRVLAATITRGTVLA